MSSSVSSTVTSSASGGSLIDVASIVSQLMTTEQQPLINLQTQQASYQAQISAYGSVQGALSTFQSAMSGLTSLSQFQAMTATSSNSSALTATATNTAAPGNYSVTVSTLAQAQSLVAAGVASQTAAIGVGGTTTLSFDLGTITGNTLNAATGTYGTSLSNASVAADGKTVTVASTANLAVGATLSGDGFPPGTTIASITNGTTFVTSAPDTNTGVTGLTLQAEATFTSNGSGTKTVTIDSSNNTLQSIAAAINAANIGVNATIINDGSSTPYRLTLTSSSGASNSIKIGVTGDAALSSLLAEDPASSSGQSLTQTSAAQNANLTVNGVAVTSTSNTVSSAVQGLTFNLLQTSSSPVSISVAQNTSSASTAVSSFVSAYNALHTAVSKVTAYNASTQTASILQGDFAANTVASQLRQMLNTPVTGAGSLSTLADIGVTFQTDGSLAVDQTKLNTALSSNFSGIAALFGTVGQASDPQISYSSAASTVKAGNYAVNITQLATQGNIVGSAAAGTTTITAGVNDSLNVTVNGISTTVTLAPGAYTAASLAAEVQTAINGASVLSGASASVAVTQTGGIFTLTSNKCGSSSNVSISGNGATNLLGGAPVSTAGLDVAGTIGGQTATGLGQFLTSGGGNSLGLKIQVNGGALGTRGTVSYSQGYAGILSQWATSQDGSSGLVAEATNGLNSSLKTLGNQVTAVQARLVALQAQYTRQYTALDQTLQSMNSTSQYLTQQLAALAK